MACLALFLILALIIEKLMPHADLRTSNLLVTAVPAIDVRRALADVFGDVLPRVDVDDVDLPILGSRLDTYGLPPYCRLALMEDLHSIPF